MEIHLASEHEQLVLITGANGFLGSEVVRQSVFAHLPVCTTDKRAESIISNVDYRPADILDLSKLNSVFRGVTQVIHAAGLAHVFDDNKANTAPFKAINEQGTANMARVAADAGVRHFILISSVSVYGPFTRGVYTESAPCCPEGPYAISKYQAEQRAIEIAQQSGMALTILRLATLYGEGDPGNIGRLMRAIDRRRFLWVGDGSNRKSLLHREDAARACLTAVQYPASGIKIYNVSAPSVTMREVVCQLAEALGRHIWPFRIPATLALFAAKSGSKLFPNRFASTEGIVRKWLADDVYDASEFAGRFDFHAKVTLSDGLKREVAWYKN